MRMWGRSWAYLSVAVIAAVFTPTLAHAQASITGVVRDTSGSVLPGVTVEASSAALIEKARSVVSDGGGQYRIVDLRPGVYAVTFTLTGFNTFVRDGLELTGDFTATINAELRVGSIEETVTVTGEAPVVDVQGVTRQRVLTNEVIEAVPSGRYFVSLGVLVPGISANCGGPCGSYGNASDVGGATGDTRSQLVVHGSRFRDQRMTINGMSITGATGGGIHVGPNMEAMEEVQIETSGAEASLGTGGVRVNLVPKDGGNIFAGSLFVSGTNEHLQGSNLTQRLKDRHLTAITRVKYLYDISPTFGGPIKKDKLWFFTSYRQNNTVNYVANSFRNANENNPNAWTYVPDLSSPSTTNSPVHPVGARFTWQATPRNKIAFSFDVRDRCECPNVINGTPREAAMGFIDRPDNLGLLSWSSPVTNRLLLEAAIVDVDMGWASRYSDFLDDHTLVRVIEQTPPPSYLGVSQYRSGSGNNSVYYPYWNSFFNATYVTGAHALKAGFNFNWGRSDARFIEERPITSYTFNNGIPVSFIVNSDPRVQELDIPREIGLFIQDKWTYGRMTLSGGLRYDHIKRVVPPQVYGPAPLLPTRNIEWPGLDVTGYHDVSPRMGLAYDLFGTGKTAIKASLNRYIADASVGSGNNVPIGSPQQYYQSTATRSWTDNGNFIPDCDLANPALQDNRASGGDLCGAFTGASANFGRSGSVGTVDDRDVDFGWGNRGYNWEFATTFQQELVPQRVSVDVGYFRRWFGNFTVTDNFNLTADSFTKFSVAVPNDDRLPLSGRVIEGFLNVNPNAASLPTDNHVRLTKHYGDQYEYWHGIDVNGNVRLGGGALIQGGLSTGRRVTDNCEILAKVPEGSTLSGFGALATINGPLAIPFCHQAEPFLLQVKLLGTYTIPKWDVQLSGTFQSVPGPALAATLVVDNADVRQSLGRDLSGSARNVTVNIVAPGSLYGDRLIQTDLRVGKIIRFGRTRRVTASADLFNVFNADAVLSDNSNYANWRVPTVVMSARMLKFTVSTSF